LQLIRQPKNARNKTQFLISIKGRHVSAPGCHPKGVLWLRNISPTQLLDLFCMSLYFERLVFLAVMLQDRGFIADCLVMQNLSIASITP